jgi:hypothetical protein
MGEGTADLTRSGGNGASVEQSRATAHRLESEIAALRETLAGLVSELDRRRHEALDLGLQLRRHRHALTLAGIALGSVVAGLVVWRHRRREPIRRLQQLGQALSRMSEHPERVAVQPTVPQRIVAAAGAAAATALVRALIARAR